MLIFPQLKPTGCCCCTGITRSNKYSMIAYDLRVHSSLGRPESMLSVRKTNGYKRRPNNRFTTEINTKRWRYARPSSSCVRAYEGLRVCALYTHIHTNRLTLFLHHNTRHYADFQLVYMHMFGPCYLTHLTNLSQPPKK